MKPNLLNPSGGFFYHYLAILRSGNWQNYQRRVRSWLEAMEINESKILLIGPSAGYTLSKKFLQQFNQIDVLEIDRISPVLLKYRFPNRNFSFHNKNFLHDKKTNFDLQFQFLKQFPNHFVLFCNLLGQIPLLNKRNPNFEIEWKNYLDKLALQLQNRTWASYHDILSFEGKLNLQPKDFLNLKDFDHVINIVKKTTRNYEINFTDHLMSQAFPEIDQKIFYWPLTKRKHHFIGAKTNCPMVPNSI